MDTRDGKIYEVPINKALEEVFGFHTCKHLISITPTPQQRAEGKVGRNEPCPCGSGKKFKNCHRKRTKVYPIEGFVSGMRWGVACFGNDIDRKGDGGSREMSLTEWFGLFRKWLESNADRIGL